MFAKTRSPQAGNEKPEPHRLKNEAKMNELLSDASF